MNYELAFDPRALKEWQKLGVTVREQFKKKLEDVLKGRAIHRLNCGIYRTATKLSCAHWDIAWSIPSMIKSYSCW